MRRHTWHTGRNLSTPQAPVVSLAPWLSQLADSRRGHVLQRPSQAHGHEGTRRRVRKDLAGARTRGRARNIRRNSMRARQVVQSYAVDNAGVAMSCKKSGEATADLQTQAATWGGWGAFLAAVETSLPPFIRRCLPLVRSANTRLATSCGWCMAPRWRASWSRSTPPTARSNCTRAGTALR